jgi:serine/threonine protein kinase
VAKPDVTTIGKYQVLERIATGDLAEIYKARLDGIAGFRRTFAIKRVRPHLAALDSYAEMIEEEARIAGLLSHGNIVQLLDLGRDDGVLYLVMEFVDGWDLGAVLAKAQEEEVSIPFLHVAWMGVQLLKALEYAHKREVIRDGERVPLDLVHRDVSPSNVLISRQGEVKLTDFGIARASLKMMQTHPDLVQRRFDYMSPEQARGADITQAADLFATGVVLYEALALEHPFRRDGEFATLEAIRDGDYVPLDERRQDLPQALVDAIHGALSPAVEDRPIDATAFKNELMVVLEGGAEVYTQETLAAWLRDLLGARPAAAPASMSIEQGLADLPVVPDATLPSVGPAPLVTELPEVPESTSGDDESRTVVVGREELEGWGEEEGGATVVNRDMALRLAALRNDAPPGLSVNTPRPPPPPKAKFETDDATRVRPKLVRELLDGPAPVAASPGAGWFVGALSAGFMLLVGALLGAVLVVAYGRSGGMTVHPPMLDVSARPGVEMRVMVDGELISGPRRLSAGRHRLRVDVEGADLWEVDLTLEEGEYRLMMIEAYDVGTREPEATD